MPRRVPLFVTVLAAGEVVSEIDSRTYGPLKVEKIRHIAGRFFIKRLVNIGATGYQRSWTDNILWHHFCHFVDLGMYLFDGAPIRRVQSYLGELHPTTGIPMECIVMVETEADQSLLVHGSYHAAYRFYDKLIVTDKDTYFYDILSGTLKTSSGTAEIETEQQLFEHQQADVEDLLGAALNLSIEQSYLDVHYRSRNAELIAFSNEHFYGKRLQAIPGHPSNRSRFAPLTLYRADGTYAEGCNEREAEHVCRIVQDLLARLEAQ